MVFVDVSDTWLATPRQRLAVALAGPAATEAVPDSASASSAGLTNWLAQVAGTAPEDKEALDAGRFAPPQPDDTEPVVLP